ncbi:unnamed protein product, partial [Dicrocoelium dendriticum]
KPTCTPIRCAFSGANEAPVTDSTPQCQPAVGVAHSPYAPPNDCSFTAATYLTPTHRPPLCSPSIALVRSDAHTHRPMTAHSLPPPT